MENTKMITLFGIPNCDTVKKARAWLTAQGLDYQFHDFKKQGVPPERLNAWLAAVGWEKLLNRQGTSWRKLDAPTQATAVDAESAAKLLILNASLIKRPVVEWADLPCEADISVGFDAENWAKRV
jgi:Spx/MgsR family transcriptional regulator